MALTYEYYCPGHKALHCSYGYRDINVYITLPSKDDVFKGTTDASHTTFQYLIPCNYEGTSFNTKEVTMEYEWHWDGYRRRMDNFVNNGFWDYQNHACYSHFDTETRIVTCDLPCFNDDGSVHKGAPVDKRCAGNIEWCNSLYLTDWYIKYGITSIAVVGVKISLTDTEMMEYMNAIDTGFTSLSASRRQLVGLALEQVGRIGFWYGGKPEHAGWNDEWGQVAPITNLYYGYNTSYGRTIIGLDAFGFIGWCYWTNYGIEPDMSSFGFVDSLNLT